MQMAVCVFIVVAGLTLFQPGNMVPFAPMGVSGVIRGSSAAFFGYLGYDEVRGLLGKVGGDGVPVGICWHTRLLEQSRLAGLFSAGVS